MENKINVMIAINSKYIMPAKTMLYSLGKNTNADIDVYLLHFNLTKNEISDLRKFLYSKCNINLVDIAVDYKIFEKYPISNQFSREIYLRLICKDVLPADMDKILWLDSDMIVLGDISELYKKDIGDKMLSVVEDIGDDEQGIIEKRQERLNNLDMTKYFNSGMLLINLKKMRKEFDVSEMFEYMDKNKESLYFPDQDVLNRFFWNDVKYVERKWNKQIFSYEYIDLNEFKLNNNIIHYVGQIKPWNFRYEGNAKEYYIDVLKKVKYRSLVAIRVKRILFRLKNIIKG